MSTVNTVKALLMVLSALAFVAVIFRPRPAGGGKLPVYKGHFLELIFLVANAATSHTLLLVSQDPLPRDGPLVPWLCPTSSVPFDALTGFSARFSAGIALVSLGIVIKDDHSLITRGPYQYIRHQAMYTGAALVLIGSYLIHFGPAGYVTRCRTESTPAASVGICRVGTTFSVLPLVSRECFGQVWEEYKIDIPGSASVEALLSELSDDFEKDNCRLTDQES
ncbi:hypothetical protein V8D89_001602 [Ganoderma adspersum]